MSEPKFKPGDIVEYSGGFRGRHEPKSFIGSVGIVRQHDSFVRIDWISVADIGYVQSIHGCAPENLKKLGHICQSHSIAS